MQILFYKNIQITYKIRDIVDLSEIRNRCNKWSFCISTKRFSTSLSQAICYFSNVIFLLLCATVLCTPTFYSSAYIKFLFSGSDRAVCPFFLFERSMSTINPLRARIFDETPRRPQNIEYTNNRLREEMLTQSLCSVARHWNGKVSSVAVESTSCSHPETRGRSGRDQRTSDRHR